jgi:hypothetical protein
MITRALGVIFDNGEEVLIDLPETTQLLENLAFYEAANARLRSRYDDICKFSFLSVVANVILLLALGAIWWLR